MAPWAIRCHAHLLRRPPSLGCLTCLLCALRSSWYQRGSLQSRVAEEWIEKFNTPFYCYIGLADSTMPWEATEKTRLCHTPSSRNSQFHSAMYPPPSRCTATICLNDSCLETDAVGGVGEGQLGSTSGRRSEGPRRFLHSNASREGAVGFKLIEGGSPGGFGVAAHILKPPNCLDCQIA